MASLQQQFTHFWQSQSKAQRLTLITLLLAGLVLVPLLISWATTPSYSVAFSGLSEADAGQIIQKLDEAGIPYRLSGSGTIQVPANKVYETRLKMAREGLPRDSSVGFELFSGNTLGMTEFTQRVNYQRALEGELERTISSLAAVKAVRVHIVTPEKSLLSDRQPLTTASVTVQENPGQRLDAAQVQAITHLVASSVEGLKSENVAVVDTNGNLLAAGAASGETAAALAQTDSRRAAEVAAAAEIQKKTQNLLDSVLGPNRSVVQASVIMDWVQRETTTLSFDPTPAAIRSSQTTTETYTTNNELTGGIPGAASNLPTPAATLSAEGGGTIYQRTDETVNYEITQTQSLEISAPGEIERVSLSVLVDGISDPQQLNIIKDAVAAAAGINAERGDVLSVESLAFDRSYYTEQAELMAADQKQDQYFKIGTAVAAVLLLAAFLWYVQRLLKNLRLATTNAWTPVMKTVSEAALKPPAPHSLASGENTPALQPRYGAVESAPKPAAPRPQDEQLQQAITRLSEENPASVAEIIQIWLNEDNK